MITPSKLAPPDLPIAPQQYTGLFQNQLSNVLRLFFNSLTNSVNTLISDLPLAGTSTFTGGTTLVVTLSKGMTGTTYKVVATGSGNHYYWVTAKTRTSFTLNANAASSDTVDWILIQ